MPLLVVRQAGDDPARFLLLREDGKSRPAPVEVPAAQGFPVEERPQSDLMAELRWYLENFLEYPFPPETGRAERLLRALRSWGEAAFEALFGDRVGGELLAAATAGGHDKLRLQIRSDDPRVLAWPWEALHDPRVGPLGQLCQIERRLDAVGDPPPLSPNLPRDRVNVLLVTARPYEQDVAYRNISRPLVELIARHRIPARVHLLRPPTFERLLEHLRQRPGFYHILHFDGHGGYLRQPAGTVPGSNPAAHAFAGRVGKIAFEAENGGPNYIAADQLAPLLREVAVPVVVLNACRSAMLDAEAESAFASIAAALLQSGTRSAVAMGYNLYISAAEVLFPPFYRCLFESGSVPEAVRAGRQALEAKRERVCVRGRFPLTDWLVPVLYQHEDVSLAFATEGPAAEAPSPAPPFFGLEQETPLRSFVGRDGALLQLERALRRRPAGILIHGLGGVGKTTLARGLLDWLRDTEGLGDGAFWFSFQEIRSAEYVWNRLGEKLFGPNFSATVPREEKVDRLAAALREHQLLIVWDNFEVVTGLPGEGTPSLSEADRDELKAFLTALHGNASKVVITSRSEESWLGETRLRVPLAGLQGEERWEYCETIVQDLGLQVNRNDSDLKELMDLLDGHPLAMRVILRELEKRPARALIQGLQSDLEKLGLTESTETARLFATLRLPFAHLPEELRPLLVPLALHQRFVEGGHLEAMARFAGSDLTRAQIDELLARLTVAGLLRDLGQAAYEMHPALTGYLRARELGSVPLASREPWTRGFVDVLGRLANDLAPRPLHEQRRGFYLHRTNFRTGLAEARSLGMQEHQAAILQGLAAHAQNLRDFTEAADLFEELAENQRELGNEAGEAAAYHHLGIADQEQRVLITAERWYRKALQINEKIGNEHGTAATHHQLGKIAQEQRDFAAAEQWYRKNLQINEKTGNEHDAAFTYHQLGNIAYRQRDFTAAEQWYRKALQIREKTGNEHDAAITYHQLGSVAQDQHNFTAAEQWYQKAIQVKEKDGDEHGAASTYHQLGMIAQEKRDFTAAEQRYRKALQTNEKTGNEHDTAITYHQLGIIAQEQRDFTAAEQWYRKALQINEKIGNKHDAAATYYQLGCVAQEQRELTAAEQWCRNSLQIYEKTGNEHGAAMTYSLLGILVGFQEQFEDSGRWLLRSIQTFLRCNDPHAVQRNVSNFEIVYRYAPTATRLKLRVLWDEAGVGPWPFGEDASGATPTRFRSLWTTLRDAFRRPGRSRREGASASGAGQTGR